MSSDAPSVFSASGSLLSHLLALAHPFALANPTPSGLCPRPSPLGPPATPAGKRSGLLTPEPGVSGSSCAALGRPALLDLLCAGSVAGPWSHIVTGCDPHHGPRGGVTMSTFTAGNTGPLACSRSSAKKWWGQSPTQKGLGEDRRLDPPTSLSLVFLSLGGGPERLPSAGPFPGPGPRPGWAVSVPAWRSPHC